MESSIKMHKTYLITGKSCSNCDMLKKMLKLMRLTVDEEIDANSTTGSNYTRQAKARSIPVLVKVNGNGEVVDSLIGINHTDKRFREVCNG